MQLAFAVLYQAITLHTSEVTATLRDRDKFWCYKYTKIFFFADDGSTLFYAVGGSTLGKTKETSECLEIPKPKLLHSDQIGLMRRALPDLPQQLETASRWHDSPLYEVTQMSAVVFST